MLNFQSYAPARDWRMLIRHMCKGTFHRRYYPPGSIEGMTWQQLGHEVQGFLAFFAHRNFNVPSSGDTRSTELPYKKKVTVAWAAAALRAMQTMAEALIRHVQPLEEKFRGAENHEWLRVASRELLDAAKQHLDSVSRIRSIFAELHSGSEPPSVDAAGVLEMLHKQIEVDRSQGDATTMSSLSQFALFSLWTRFGHRGGALSDVEELKAEEGELRMELVRGGKRGRRVNQPNSLSVIRVVRHSLQSQADVKRPARVGEKLFVKSTTDFLADPRGVTNLDLVHRALDVTTKALHTTLMRAVPKVAGAHERIDIAKQHREAPDKADLHLVRLVGKVCALQDEKLVADRGGLRSAPPGLGCKFKKERTPAGEATPHPGDDYFDRDGPDTAKVRDFLMYYSAWYDSRHMAEFLDRISTVCRPTRRRRTACVFIAPRARGRSSTTRPTRSAAPPKRCATSATALSTVSPCSRARASATTSSSRRSRRCRASSPRSLASRRQNAPQPPSSGCPPIG